MSESLHKPHDYIFRNSFSDKPAAINFFQENLPEQLTNQVDWDTLVLEDKTFIDEQFRETVADVFLSGQTQEQQKEPLFVRAL